MNVLHLVPRFSRGGVAVVICNLIDGLNEYGVRSHVVCESGDWTSRLDDMNVHWQTAPLFPSTPQNAIHSFFVLRRMIKRHEIDLLHSHHRFSSLVGRTVARSLRIPFVCTVHDLASGNARLTRMALGRPVLVFSGAVEKHLTGHFGIEQERIEQVPMGIQSLLQPEPATVHALKREVGCNENAAVVAFLGRLEFEKGADVFLRAVPRILQEAAETSFWIIGEGSMSAELKALAQELGIAGHVSFLGWRDDLGLVIGSTDIVVAPSRREGFGRAVLEAMTLGKAVIATETGGLCDLVEHERTGILVPPLGSDSLAGAVIRLLHDKEFASRLGLAAREVTHGKHSVRAMARETHHIYQQLVSSRS